MGEMVTLIKNVGFPIAVACPKSTGKKQHSLLMLYKLTHPTLGNVKTRECRSDKLTMIFGWH